MDLASTNNLEEVKGVGPHRKQLLEKLGIFSLEDLLLYAPKRYEDRRQVKKIADLVVGEVATIQGEITGLSKRRRGRLGIFRMRIKDDTQRLSCLWFNQNYLIKQFKKKERIIVTGKVGAYKSEIQIVNPEFEVFSEDEEEENDLLHMGRIVPVYSLTEGLPQKVIRSLVYDAVEKFLDSLPENLPDDWIRRQGWLGRLEAIRELHFPSENGTWERARERLAYEEFLILQLGILQSRSGSNSTAVGFAHIDKTDLARRFLRRLPFELTAAQRRVIEEITKDMTGAAPMNRLLQGDVGSGKTVVAMWAMATALGNGTQCALMAPTEILAEQHYLNLRRWFEPLGVRVGLLRSEMEPAEKRRMLRALETGELRCVVGTHALIQEKVKFPALSLVVIDEQHKFGVMQRARLREKGMHPDLLIMTATPIPRTLALTVYGDLDVSILNELPPGKAEIKTRWITEKKLSQAFEWIREEVTRGQQVYLLYPLIEESDKVELKSAVEMYEHLSQKVFKTERLGLMHGRLPIEEKERVMAAFKNRKIDIMVSTTVIEVGIDIPNATIMLIENAERFGLAQLHQLRGRVGRGSQLSYCILVGNPKTEDGKIRLKTMVETTDGFKIAEEDLRLRGPGEFFGLRQHGLPALRVGDLVGDFPLVELARRHALELLGSGEIHTPAWAPLLDAVSRRFGSRLSLAHA